VGLLLPSFFVIVFFNALFLFIIVFYLVLFLNKKDFGKAKPPKKFPFVSIVVPSYNSISTIAKCIDSIKNISWHGRMEIIVVDDFSSDGSREYLEKIKGIKLIKLGKNSGKAVALNTAFSRAKSEFVVCVDSDSYPERDVLLKTMGYFADDKVAAVTCLVLPDKKKSFIEKIQYFEYALGFGLNNALFSSIGASYVVPGPFTVFRRGVFSVVGFFQPGNLAEDMEFGLRLKRHGSKIMTCFEAVVFTDVPRTFRTLIKQRDRWYRGGTFNFIQYRDLLFNKTNPDFGFFVMPFIFFSNVLTIVLLARTAFYFFNDLFSFSIIALKYFALGGSLFFSIPELVIPPSILFFASSYLLVCFYFALGFSAAKQWPSLKELPVVVMLIFIYPFFISFIYASAYFKEMFGVRAKWLRATT
jgi:cellulose synthase/poly-beta-1,6-N-acetylglucosamine synthase-like glycosyltransferase